MNLKDLAAPFPASDIEWRVGRAGVKNDKVWASVLAYITNRAIMQRLDDVCEPGNWRNEYRYEAAGAVLCGISVRVGDEWVTKWDGAENTDIEAVKGGLSNAMKRAAVQWGIGRYLYDLEEGYAKVHDGGAHYAAKNDKKNIPAFKWDPPALPKWALPVNAEQNGAGVKSAELESASSAAVAPHARTARTARQKAAPASPAAPTSKPDEDKVFKGVRLGDRTDEELRQLIETKRHDPLLISLVDACSNILNDRNPDAPVQRMRDAVANETAELPF